MATAGAALVHELSPGNTEALRMTEIFGREDGRVLLRLDGPSLERADLRRAILGGADLAGARLTGADLSGAYLAGSDLRNADLTGANFTGASLGAADLSGASLRFANLTGAYAPDARLHGADLTFANLHGSYLAGADLSGAVFGFTILADCSSLHEAAGLEVIRHEGPSSLDATTLRAGGGRLPASFLLGAGYTPEEIASLKGRCTAGSPAPASCFLCRSPAQAADAARLRRALGEHGVCCWDLPFGPRRGFFLAVVHDLAVRRQGGIVVLCCREAATDDAFAEAVLAVLAHQTSTGAPRLFPVDLDGFLLGDEAVRLGGERAASGSWRADWLAALRRLPVISLRDRAGEVAAIARLAASLRAPDRSAVPAPRGRGAASAPPR